MGVHPTTGASMSPLGPACSFLGGLSSLGPGRHHDAPRPRNIGPAAPWTMLRGPARTRRPPPTATGSAATIALIGGARCLCSEHSGSGSSETSDPVRNCSALACSSRLRAAVTDVQDRHRPRPGLGCLCEAIAPPLSAVAQLLLLGFLAAGAHGGGKLESDAINCGILAPSRRCWRSLLEPQPFTASIHQPPVTRRAVAALAQGKLRSGPGCI